MTTHHARSVAATALTAAGLLLTGCSNASAPTRLATHTSAAPASTDSPSAVPSDSTAATASASACGLATASEVGVVTGQTMTKVSDAGAICAYSATADPSNTVDVTFYPDLDSMALQKQLEPGSQHLPGLGDDAFWNVAGNLFVQKGSRGFSIAVTSLSLTTRAAPATMLSLAKIAADRL